MTTHDWGAKIRYTSDDGWSTCGFEFCLNNGGCNSQPGTSGRFDPVLVCPTYYNVYPPGTASTICLLNPPCPNKSFLTVNSATDAYCTCNNPTASDPINYVPDSTGKSCVPEVAVCPAHASGMPCACETGYKFDAAGTSCVPDAVCPVDKLTAPPFNDECSTSLEQGKGNDVNHKCGTLREPDMANAASCIAAKIHAALINVRPVVIYTDPSATIRTTAYQNHLLEIWTKSQELDTIMSSVVYTREVKLACAPRYVDVNNEKKQHHINYKPSSSGGAAPHVERRAIDVPEAVSDALMDQVTTYTTTVTTVNGKKKTTITIASDVEDYMHSATVNPPACNPNLSWGGRFDSPDWVHFQLP